MLASPVGVLVSGGGAGADAGVGASSCDASDVGAEKADVGVGAEMGALLVDSIGSAACAVRSVDVLDVFDGAESSEKDSSEIAALPDEVRGSSVRTVRVSVLASPA